MAEAADVSVKSVAKANNKDASIGSINSADDLDLDNIILAEIKWLKSKKKRADFIPVSSSLERQHGLAQSDTHQRMLHMILNGKIECSLAIPKGSQQKQSIIIEEHPPDSDPIASFIDDLKSNEGASKATKMRPANTVEPDEGFAHASRFLETVNDLAKSLQKTNDMLNLERENSRKFMEENFQLQIRLRDLEIFQARKQVSPTLKRHDTFLIDSLENNTSEVNTMKQVGETQASNKSVNSSGKPEIPRTAHASITSESHTVAHGTGTAKQHKNKEGKSKKNTQNQQQSRGKENNRNGSSNNRNGSSKLSKMVSNETSPHPIQICMVGDSQLRRMDAEKMSNNHHQVVLNAKSGMKVEEAANHVDCDADVIIMHAGTNNLRDSTPEEVAEKVVKTFKKIKQKNSKAQLAYSSIFRRKGNAAANGMNVKVFQTNKILKEELMLQGIDFIDNDNILYGNICDDGLHINQGGAKRFARNVKKYVEYW